MFRIVIVYLRIESNLPLINVLIRTSKRPELFARAVQSVKSQTYKNTRIIVAYDSYLSGQYTQGYERFFFISDLKCDHFWNLYCNYLKALVTDGYFFYLDDDDYLYRNDVLENIAPHLNDPEVGVICQMLRNGKPKPASHLMRAKKIIRGRIGSPCLFLHHSKKNIANWDGERAADYRWIKEVESKMPLKFVQQVVVETGNNGLHGR